MCVENTALTQLGRQQQQLKLELGTPRTGLTCSNVWAPVPQQLLLCKHHAANCKVRCPAEPGVRMAEVGPLWAEPNTPERALLLTEQAKALLEEKPNTFADRLKQRREV